MHIHVQIVAISSNAYLIRYTKTNQTGYVVQTLYLPVYLGAEAMLGDVPVRTPVLARRAQQLRWSHTDTARRR
jgi:hypothetical protein